MATTVMPDAQTRSGVDSGTTGWVGWIAFAGIMMMIAGALQAFYGLVAVFNDEWVVWGNRANLMLDLTAWGWVHVAIGAVVIVSGIGVFAGNVLARTVGVLVAGVSVLANFAFIPAYPVWSLVVIAIDTLVIYALVAHGAELRKA